MIDVCELRDELSLWWLGEEGGQHRPRHLIGRIFLADGNRQVGLEYASSWLKNGFALSDDLPLAKGIFLPLERGMAVGAVDDARPDRWGERVIRSLYNPARLSVLECLRFAGDDRCGALGVSNVGVEPVPCSAAVTPGFNDLFGMERAIAAMRAGQRLNHDQAHLVKAGAAFGGARPKSLIQIEDAQYLVKFSEGEDFDTELVEHATMRLAAQCGIKVAPTRALPLKSGHAVASQRFDRYEGRRLHVISAKTVLQAAGMPLGYPELAQCLRSIARPQSIRDHQWELFRRMVFNILMDNTDDHEKNHAFVRASDGYYDLSPAYDVVPSVQGLGQQQLSVGLGGAVSSIENALSQIEAFGLTTDMAVETIKRVATHVDGWKESFGLQGVLPRDIDSMIQYIDGPNLRNQRLAFAQTI